MKNSFKIVFRYMAFLAVTALIWVAYGWWRPWGPMLGLHHIEHLPEESSMVSLTFDDAPHPLTTPLLLAALKHENIKASFFVVGNNLLLYPELSRRAAAEGHQLTNHSQYHHNLTTVTPAEYAHEVNSCFDVIQSFGQTTRLFRPPGGGMNHSVMKYLYDNDITLAWWSNNVGDYAMPQAWKIGNQVGSTVRSGDIILLHDELTSTAKAIPLIARAAEKQGLKFMPMPESLGDLQRPEFHLATTGQE